MSPRPTRCSRRHRASLASSLFRYRTAAARLRAARALQQHCRASARTPLASLEARVAATLCTASLARPRVWIFVAAAARRFSSRFPATLTRAALPLACTEQGVVGGGREEQ